MSRTKTYSDKTMRGIFLRQQKLLPSFRFLFPILYRRIRVVGAEYLHETPGPVIFAVSHQSDADRLLLLLALQKAGVLHKYIPSITVGLPDGGYAHYGWLVETFAISLLGVKLFGLTKLHTRKGYHPLRRHMRYGKQRVSIVIFPEGEIVRTKHLGRIRRGVVDLAKETELPIIPTRILGAHGFSRTEFVYTKRDIRVCFCPPVWVPSTIHSPKEKVCLTTHIRALMEQAEQ